MAITPIRYVRKPIFVDAVKITEQNFVEAAKWCHGQIRTQAEELLVDQNLDDPKIPRTCFIHVRVQSPKHIRQTRAYVGDWLLYADLGGYKIYTQKAFDSSFDEVG
jgi:hypothetical protein